MYIVRSGVYKFHGSERFPELRTLRDLELYGTRNFTTSGLPDELSQDYQMNFHWNSGSPLMDWIFDPELRTGSLTLLTL